MTNDALPTEITRADINKVMKAYEDKCNKPTPIVSCTSCDRELAVVLTDYYTGQCQDCFHNRKPWCTFSPVRDTYFKEIFKDEI